MSNMKMVVATVLLAAAIASPALAQSTQTQQQGARSGKSTQSQQRARSGQNAGGTYQGYPTSAWQRPGSW